MDTPGLALKFRRFDLVDGGPASAIFADKKKSSLCGIYVLEFEDGMRYVGKTVNIVARLGKHRRYHGDVVSFMFAECPAADLDFRERETIRTTQVGHELRNLKLTDWPGGRGDIEYDTEEGDHVFLPWVRMKRETVMDEPVNSKTRRFWEISSRPDYSLIVGILARYVHESIPDPVDTQRILWSLSALPSTSKQKGFQRIVTLNCGSVEALFTTETTGVDGSRVLEWNINVDGETFSPELSTLGRMEPLIEFSDVSARYKVGQVLRLTCTNSDSLQRALGDDKVLDAIYKFNVRQMRRGASVYGKFHNSHLASDVLRAARVMHD